MGLIFGENLQITLVHRVILVVKNALDLLTQSAPLAMVGVRTSNIQIHVCLLAQRDNGGI